MTGRSYFHCTQSEPFFKTHRLTSFQPRDYRVVFLYIKQRAARRRPLKFNFSCFSLRKRVRRTISAWRNRSSVGQALSVQLAHVETPQHKRVEIVGIENAFMVFPVDILFHNNAPFGRPLRPYYQSITFPFHIGISEIKQPPFFRFGRPSLTFRLYYMRRRELCQLFCEKNLKIFQKIFS